jgi:hypothetical protein
MPFREFWVSVRSTIKVMAAPQLVADAPRLDDAAIERQLRQPGDMWLTPAAVAGFEKSDLAFLPEEERTRLADLVQRFIEVAETVNPRGPAPIEAVDRGLLLFKAIIQELEFDRFADPEAFRLGKQIEREIQKERPTELAELRFNTGTDHSRDPGLWIWVFLTTEASNGDEEFLRTAQMLSERLEPVARRIAPERWPYLSFRSIAELAEPVEAS